MNQTYRVYIRRECKITDMICAVHSDSPWEALKAAAWKWDTKPAALLDRYEGLTIVDSRGVVVY